VLVHAHETGEDGAARQIDPLRAGGLARDELAGGDEKGLVLARRGAGAVDDADVLEDE
jgi:hypothetical protein